MKRISYLIIPILMIAMCACNKSGSSPSVGVNIPTIDSLQVYLDRAKKGNAVDQYIAATLLLQKKSSIDSIEAIDLLNKAALQDFPRAELSLTGI